MTALLLTLDAVCCLVAAGGVFVYRASTDEEYRTRWH